MKEKSPLFVLLIIIGCGLGVAMLKGTFDNDNEISKINGLNPVMSLFTGPSKVSSTSSSKGGSRKSKRKLSHTKNKTKGQNKR